MFDILFGWRKASKCENLIRGVECRLKLLKNKRLCVVKILRQDVAQLLKHGNHQTAFQRVEKLFKDESMVELYDHLGNFCEFIRLKLPYIRKHKDCPDDINEAISTLIYSSARLRDLPELISLRRLFGERYGLRFVTTALELSPGNLVNDQIQERLCLKKVPDDVKYRLLNEIAMVEPGQLLLPHKPCLQEQEISKTDAQRNSRYEAVQVQMSDVTEAEGKIVHVDLPSDSVESSKDQHNGPAKEQIYQIEKQNLTPREGEKFVKPEECTITDLSRDSDTSCGVRGIGGDASSETCTQQPDEMVHLDNTEVLVSPVSKKGDFQDQSIFMLKSFEVPQKEKTDVGNEYNVEEQRLSPKEKSRKSRKSSRKRMRRISVSPENRNATDVKYYYSQADDELSDNRHKKSHYQKHRRNKILVEKSVNLIDAQKGQNRFVQDRIEGRNGDIANDDSTAVVHILKTREIQHGLELHRYSCSISEPENNVGDGEEGTVVVYSKAMTMSIERPHETDYLDNIYRSNTFPVEKPRHIHPKLPDYDDLAEMFMALKRESISNQTTGNLGGKRYER